MEDIEWFDYPDLINPPDDLELIEEEEIEDGGDGNGTRLTNSELDIITARVAESLIVPLQSFAKQASNGISTYAISISEAAYINGRLNTAFTRLTAQDSKIASNMSNINSTRSTVNSVNSTVRSHTTNISSLKGNVQKLMSWQTSANSKLNQLPGIKSDISALKSWRTSHTSAFNSLKSTVTSQGNRLNTVETWKAGANSTITSHTSRLNTLESWRSGHDTWAGNLSKRVDSLESWKTTANGNISSIGNRVSALETWRSTISGTVSNLTTRMGNIESWKTSFVNSQNSWNSTHANRIKKLEDRNRVVQSADLNELIEYGEYYLVNPEKNVPMKGNGFLEVIGVDKYTILQRFTEYSSNRTFERNYYYASGFGSWKETTALKSDIDGLKARDNELSQSLSKEIEERKANDLLTKNNFNTIDESINDLKISTVSQIAWNAIQSDRIKKLEERNRRIHDADLNELIEHGEYYLINTAKNAPSKGNGFLEVIGTDKDMVLQRFTEYGSNRTFERIYYYISGFGSWKETTVNKSDIEALKAKDIELSKELSNEVFKREANDLLHANKFLDIDASIKKIEGFSLTQTAWNLQQSNRIKSLEDRNRRINNADLNELTEHGEYYLIAPTANFPIKGNGYLEVIGTDNDLILQRFTEYVTNKKFERRYYSISGFGEWKEVSVSTEKINLMSEAIDDIKLQIDNLQSGFSDIGIIAAIVASMKSNEDLWSADNYSGGSVGDKDGKAVRLFKVQFQESRSHFTSIMKHYFDMGDPNSSIYRLRYSIVAGFEETKDLLLEWFTHLLDSGNTTNSLLVTVTDWLEMQNDHFKDIYEVLCIITDWLKLIYQKPPPTINVTVPEVTLSEDGNGWLKTLIKTIGGVIETAIKTLGTLLETAIGEVGQLLRDLLAFLDGLLDDLLHLIVPENLDFMDRKFDDTSKTIKLKFGSIFDGIDSFKNMFNGRSTFKDIEISLGAFGNGSFEIPVSILNTLAPFVYPLITGGVALEFLIDMYKWFHTKGEIVE